MSLKDRIQADIGRVFMNEQHFAERHMIDDTEIVCTVDTDEMFKRRNNNVGDLSWDLSTDEVLIFTPVSGMPYAPQANQTIYFDRRPMRVIWASENAGIYEIRLSVRNTREVI